MAGENIVDYCLAYLNSCVFVDKGDENISLCSLLDAGVVMNPYLGTNLFSILIGIRVLTVDFIFLL